MQQCAGFDQAVFQAVAGSGDGCHFAGLATHDRPQANHGVVHREAELSGRQRLPRAKVAENVEGARGFAVTRDKHQWQGFETFCQGPADAERHACQTAEATALHGG